MWKRQYGKHMLILEPGIDIDGNSLGFPSGVIPRLILIWFVTEAVRTKSRKIYLGYNLTTFLRELDLDPRGGGPRSDRTRVADAIQSLLAAKISLLDNTPAGKAKYNYRSDMAISSESSLWWNADDPTKTPSMGSWIELGEKFYQVIKDSVIVCDMRALKGLKHSSLALDLYVICNFIGANYTAPRTLLTWPTLAAQLGIACKVKEDNRKGDNRNLKRMIHAAMDKVALVHPGLKFDYDRKDGGLVIYPSPPAVPRDASETVPQYTEDGELIPAPVVN